MPPESARPAVLHTYWLSSASYRLRIALGLLGLPFEAREVNLLDSSHRAPEYLDLNPQGLVPTLEIDGQVLTQSLSILEYLHATTPGSTLMPEDTMGQFQVRQLSYVIAMEIHPVCNRHVALHAAGLSGKESAMEDWMARFMGRGLAALEVLLQQAPEGRFCHGDSISMADCCLIPQLYNADRWGVPYAEHRRISEVARALADNPAVLAAHPDRFKPEGI